MTSPRTPLVRRIAAAALAIALIPTLAGCWQGFGASTTMQNSMNSGNGTQLQVGSIKIENATLIRGDDNAATLIMSLVNIGEADDVLTSVTIGDGPGVMWDGTAIITEVALASQTSVPFGYGQDGVGVQRWANAYMLELPESGYVPVTLSFATAGTAEFTVLTVPPVGYYEGIVPNPATAPAPL